MNGQPSNEPSRWAQLQSILTSTASTPSGKAMIVLGAGGLLMGLVTLVVAGVYFWSLREPAAKSSQSAQPSTGQTNLTTQTCPAASMELGERTFAVQEVNLTSQGGLPEAPEPAEVAYQVAGTGEGWVFLLGTAAYGQDPAALQSLSQATYNDQNCRIIVFQLSAPQPVSLSGANMTEPQQAELTIFIQTSPDRAGVVLQGTVVEAQPSPANAATPTGVALQVGIDIQSVQTSQVGRLMQVKASIYNFGAAAIELTGDDLSLLVPGGNTLGPTGSKPALPRTIQPRQTVAFELIFPLPSEGLGRLRVFNSEFELADFAK